MDISIEKKKEFRPLFEELKELRKRFLNANYVEFKLNAEN